MGISTLLSAATIFLLARWLGPAQFGLYGTALALAVIVTDSLDLAISSSIVNFGAKTDSRRPGLIKYGFILKLAVGLFLGLLFGSLARPVAAWLDPSLYQPLLITALVIPVLFVHRFPRAILQGEKRFLADSGLEVFSSLARFLGVFLTFRIGQLNVISSLWIYLGSYLATFLLGAGLIRWDWLAAKVDQSLRNNFFHFQKWLTVGFILAAIHGRIDSAILVKLAGTETTGIYQAAYRFFMPVIQLAAALSLVFAPRFASFDTRQEARNYLRKAGQLTSLAGLIVLGIIPLAPFLVQLIYGQEYLAAVGPTRILSLGFTMFILASPYSAYLIYSVNRTKVFALINLIQLILIIGLNFYLIPRFGASGAAMASAVTLVLVNLLIIGWSRK